MTLRINKVSLTVNDFSLKDKSLHLQETDFTIFDLKILFSLCHINYVKSVIQAAILGHDRDLRGVGLLLNDVTSCFAIQKSLQNLDAKQFVKSIQE